MNKQKQATLNQAFIHEVETRHFDVYQYFKNSSFFKQDWSLTVKVLENGRITVKTWNMIIDIPAPLENGDIEPLADILYCQTISEIEAHPERFYPFDVYRAKDLSVDLVIARFSPAMREVLDKTGVFILVRR